MGLLITNDVWQTANGVLAILGIFLVGVIASYLGRNAKRSYDEPIRFITVAFCLIVLGHTIKDGAAYAMRAWGVRPYDWVILAAMVMVGTGKLGCVLIWSDPKWGHIPWIIAALLVVAFLVFNGIYS